MVSLRGRISVQSLVLKEIAQRGLSLTAFNSKGLQTGYVDPKVSNRISEPRLAISNSSWFIVVCSHESNVSGGALKMNLKSEWVNSSR